MEIAEIEKRVVAPLEKLRPFEIIDADGAERQVFTFSTDKGNNVQVIFYAKEDLPFNKNILNGKSGFILGNRPSRRGIDEWKNFVADVAAASSDTLASPLNIHDFHCREAIAESKAIFFVENTPEHILDMAFLLGLDNPKLREARKKAAVDREYTPEVLEVIDNIIAGTVVDDEGLFRKYKKRQNQEGEALELLALLGDKEASSVLASKRRVVADWDNENTEKTRQSCADTFKSLKAEGIPEKNDYTAYHTTRYKPRITKEGVEIQSSFDATNGSMLRPTIHFSLAGPVADILGGGRWESMDYIVVGGLKEIRKRNGNPKFMSGVDTYFSVSPGQRLIIPQAQLIMPGQLPEGIIREKRGNVTIYKKEPLKPGDINTLFQEYYDKKGGSFQKKVQAKIRELIHETVWGNVHKKAEGLPTKSSYLKDAEKWYIPFIDGLQHPQKMQEAVDLMRQQGIKTAVAETLKSCPDADNAENILEATQLIERWLVTIIRNGSLASAAGSIEGSLEAKKVQMLAALWETPSTTGREAHANDPDGFVFSENFYFLLKEIGRLKPQVTEFDNQINSGRTAGELGGDPGVINLPEGGWVNIRNRIAVMSYVKRKRNLFSQDPNIRRMQLLAGII